MIPKLLTNKITAMTFEEKVKSMSASDIIMAMVKGLTHPPIINIDMNSYGGCHKVEEKIFFGFFKVTKKVCYGCAATNTVCQISGKVFKGEEINEVESRAEFIGSSIRFLEKFEGAINVLRCGDIIEYNDYANYIGIATIKRIPYEARTKEDKLPWLEDNYTNEDLEPYKRLAKYNQMLEITQDEHEPATEH